MDAEFANKTPEELMRIWRNFHRAKTEAEAKDTRDEKYIGFLKSQIKKMSLSYPFTKGILTQSTPGHTPSQLRQKLDCKLVTRATRRPTTTQVDNERVPAPFHFYCIAGSQRVAIVCDRVFERWLASRHFKRKPSDKKLQDYRRIIETIVSNLLYSTASGYAGVRFSRDRAMYAGPSRYRPAEFNERFLNVIDDLAALNILRQIKGDTRRVNPAHRYFPETATKFQQAFGLKQTCIQPGTVFIQELAQLSITPTLLNAAFINEGREVLILKKGEGSALLEYQDKDFPEMEKYRRQMQIVNEMLKHAGDLITPDGHERFDQRRRYLVRRFTHGSTESGGRLWEGFWINDGMKKTERPALMQIKGEATVELDFSSMIVRLAYIVAEKPAPAGDQYAIPGLDPASRDGIKRVMGALLFDSSLNRDRFPKNVAKLFTEKDQRKGWKYVHRAIMAHHPALKAYMDRGLGHYLQFLESQIMVNVLLRCAQKGIIALPLHDCIIVRWPQKERAKHLMKETIRYAFGDDASIPVTEKGDGSESGREKVA